MANQGLSLMGFMARDQALAYLTCQCVPDDPAEDALVASWSAARLQLGMALPDAGQPQCHPLPSGFESHVRALEEVPQAKTFIREAWQLCLVDIEPLLAFQFHIDLARSEAVSAALPARPTLADAVPFCLPIGPPSVPPIYSAKQPSDRRHMHSIVVKSPSLNLRITDRGYFEKLDAVGVQLGVVPPFVQVVQFEGRHYLRNGYHRVHGLCRKGLKQVPCFFKAMQDFENVAAGSPRTFDRPLLESANPPTVRHFTTGRASPVNLRRCCRLIHVSWAEYVLYEE
jgi:hypothetical protein